MADQTYLKLQNGSDIRGVALGGVPGEDVNLTAQIVRDISAAFARFVKKEKSGSGKTLRIGIGHDSRLSAENLKRAAALGLADEGAVVFDCGLVPTPAMFMSTVFDEFKFDGAVMITASHLPFNRNGLKFFTCEGGLDGGQIRRILDDAAEAAGESRDDEANGESRDAGAKDELCNAGAEGDLTGGAGDVRLESANLLEAYKNHLKSRILRDTGFLDDPCARPLEGFHIVVDGSNGVGGYFKDVIEELGGDTRGSVCLEPDGMFPVHRPNPEDAGAMDYLKNAVAAAGGDLGVIFDADGDRAAVVFSTGEEVNKNTIIALMALIIKKDHPGTTIVTDSVTSDHLNDFLENNLGMKHHRFKRGYKNVINEAIRLNKEGIETHLAIETSGHGALKENFFLDDGAYMSAKIIAHMVNCRKRGEDIEAALKDLKHPAESRDVRININREDFKEYGQGILDDFLAYAKENELDIVEPNFEGIRVRFNDEKVRGWMLIRLSLHDPQISMNIESDVPGGVGEVTERLDGFFEKYGENISRA